MEQDASSAVAGEQEATFIIKWDGELGRDWMNRYNLELCLFSKEHIGGEAVDKVSVETQ